MSDDSGASIESPPPPSRSQMEGGNVKKNTSQKFGSPAHTSPLQVPTRSVRRTELLTALRVLKNDRIRANAPEENPLLRKFRSQKKIEFFQRCCSLDLTTQPVSSWSSSMKKKRLLIYTLNRSVFRHDWSTAARCLHMFLDLGRTCLPFVHRTLLLVLLNHPASTPETLDNFLSRVLSLRTKSEQLNFLRHSFFLPNDFDEYFCEGGVLSADHDDNMSVSEDED